MDSFNPTPKEGYHATLKDNREIYIPNWPASVSLQNLTQSGKYIGTENLLSIADINIPSVMLAITGAEDAEQTTALIKHFVTSARLDGEKITTSNFDKYFEKDLYLLCEVFAHVIKAQYSDFFERGLAKENSPES